MGRSDENILHLLSLHKNILWKYEAVRKRKGNSEAADKQYKTSMVILVMQKLRQKESGLEQCPIT